MEDFCWWRGSSIHLFLLLVWDFRCDVPPGSLFWSCSKIREAKKFCSIQGIQKGRGGRKKGNKYIKSSIYMYIGLMQSTGCVISRTWNRKFTFLQNFYNTLSKNGRDIKNEISCILFTWHISRIVIVLRLLVLTRLSWYGLII